MVGVLAKIRTDYLPNTNSEALLLESNWSVWILHETFHILIVPNMYMVRDFETIFDKYNVIHICTGETYAFKWNTVLCVINFIYTSC
jgi:hypothetical protein